MDSVDAFRAFIYALGEGVLFSFFQMGESVDILMDQPEALFIGKVLTSAEENSGYALV